MNRELASVVTSSEEWPLAADQSSIMRVGEIELDTATRTVRTASKSARLTVIEFTVLELLLRRAGCVVSREELVRVALQRSFSPYERSIDMHVSNLRKKLGVAGRGSDYIKTVRGAGYVCAARN
ncbi:MAG TPA: winged helix-turn-helix domain-containing protein [Terriglobales bacterium]|nr:winged helix-turn-helix domain-containing protein [Terriglobales bacterium]